MIRAFLATLLGAAAQFAAAATIVVTSTSDTVPGADGISLREAIGTALRTNAPTTITFSPALAGRTIVLGNPGFVIDKDDISIEGLLDLQGRPSVFLDAGAVSPIVFEVRGSRFALRKMRLIRMTSSFGVSLNLDSAYAQASDIAIEQNDFDNSGVAASSSIPISLGTHHDSVAARLSRISIASNTFTHVRAPANMPGGDGIHLHLAGVGSLIQDVVIRANVFTDLNFPIELVPDNGSGNRIVGVQIVGNDFSASDQAINLNAISNGSLLGNSIENTLIAANTFRGNNTDVAIYGGLFAGANGNRIVNTQIVGNTFTGSGFGVGVRGGAEGANGNLVQGLRIANNVFRSISSQAVALSVGGGRSFDNVVEGLHIMNNLIAGTGNTAIALNGGSDTSARNVLRNVRIINNTVVNAGGYGIWLVPNLAPAMGNDILDALVANTLLWGNANDFGGLTAAQVSNSVTTYPGFAGTNGNVVGDPAFSDPANGNYHLRPGGPAIGGGNAGVAPHEDLECRPRNGTSDIGAYVFGGSGADCSVGQRNFTSLWWDPGESGWGLNLNHQGAILFATLFTYADDGKPLWLVASNLARQPDGSYSGPLYRTTGPTFSRVPWTSIHLSTVGTMTVRPATANLLALAYFFNGASVSKIVQRQVFGSPVPTCVAVSASRSGASNFQDLWWNPAESGWGINLTHQGRLLFATLFTYDSSGRDLWLVASALALQSDGSYAGPLYTTRGPRFDSSPWSSVSVTPQGNMRLAFTSGDSGTLEYDYTGIRVTKQITRQVFAPTAPSCQ